MSSFNDIKIMLDTQDLNINFEEGELQRMQHYFEGFLIVASLLSSYMKTSLKTVSKYASNIKNSFTYPYNNDCVEGIDHKIKAS